MVTKEIELDIWSKNHVIIHSNSGELDSRYIKASFKCQDGSTLSLQGKTVKFYALKPDNTHVYKYCTVDNDSNTATVQLTTQTLSAPGIIKCEFQIYDSDNSFLKVNGLQISVSSELDFSEAIESTSEFDAFTSEIAKIKNLSDEIGNLDDLTTTSKNTLVEAINEVNSEITSSSATVLFENVNGTQMSLALSDSAANYKYLEIHARRFTSHGGSGNTYFSEKILNPNKKTLELKSVEIKSPSEAESITDWTLDIRTTILKFVDTTITLTSYYSGSFTFNKTSTTSETGTTTIGCSSTNNIYITQILGYK